MKFVFFRHRDSIHRSYGELLLYIFVDLEDLDLLIAGRNRRNKVRISNATSRGQNAIWISRR
jgi:hypothetical protein